MRGANLDTGVDVDVDGAGKGAGRKVVVVTKYSAIHPPRKRSSSRTSTDIAESMNSVKPTASRRPVVAVVGDSSDTR